MLVEQDTDGQAYRVVKQVDANAGQVQLAGNAQTRKVILWFNTRSEQYSRTTVGATAHDDFPRRLKSLPLIVFRYRLHRFHIQLTRVVVAQHDLVDRRVRDNVQIRACVRYTTLVERTPFQYVRGAWPRP